MQRTLLKSKIHRARVTHADLHYEGSISVDRNLLELADILPNEFVNVWNVTNGARIRTYAIEAPAGSGTVGVNGAAARHFAAGDLVIIASEAVVDDAHCRGWQPKLVFVDDQNRPTGRTLPEVAGPQPSPGPFAGVR